MYGLVNDGMRAVVVNARGEDSGRAGCANAGVPDEDIETLTAYDATAHDVFTLRARSGDLSAA